MRASVGLDAVTAGARRPAQAANGSHGATANPRSSDRREISGGIQPDYDLHRRRKAIIDPKAQVSDPRRLQAGYARVSNGRSTHERAPCTAVRSQGRLRADDLAMRDVFLESRDAYRAAPPEIDLTRAPVSLPGDARIGR